ncbi:hypothetical protein [Microbacterium sp. NPDC056234]|uniref:hypothetical protein n=1 Tax=Microbacterium sp. NPDC056234 TaxID=3345757 RepID=UPI0035D8FA37
MPGVVHSRQDVEVTEDRNLRAGRDYSLWPVLKWGHATRLASGFVQDYQLWRIGLGMETRAEYSNNRRVVTFYASLATSPPVHEWSLRFGDILHNYRSALDALAWAMVNLDDNSPQPQYEKQIYFPMKRTLEAFDKEARTKLSSAPRFILERMAMVQPFHVKPGEAVEDGIALILHDLDIEDKHKAALEAQAVAADMTSYSIRYRPADQEGWDDAGVMEPEWLAPDRPVENGDPIVRWTFPAPVEEAEVTELPLRLLVRHRGKALDVFELLQLIDWQVGQTFAVIETGRFRSEE